MLASRGCKKQVIQIYDLFRWRGDGWGGRGSSGERDGVGRNYSFLVLEWCHGGCVAFEWVAINLSTLRNNMSEKLQ